MILQDRMSGGVTRLLATAYPSYVRLCRRKLPLQQGAFLVQDRFMAIGAGPEIERLMALLSKLPGLGPRSARRAVLHLMKKRESALEPLLAALQNVSTKLSTSKRDSGSR